MNARLHWLPDDERAFCLAPLDLWLAEVETWPSDDRDDALRARMRWDPLLFYAVCFPDLVFLRFHAAHRWMAEQFQAVPPFSQRHEQRLSTQRHALEMNRGGAKTTVLKLEIVRRKTYGMEPFTVWCGPDQPNALKESRHVRRLFAEPTDEYLQLFGQPRVTGADGEWRVVTETGGRCGFLARGVPRQQVRGANLDGQRPPWIIMDDVEKPIDVRNPRLRDEFTDYIGSDVDNATPKFGGWLWGQGTRLHPDSQTARWAKSPAYTSITFRAVERFPDRSDLWEQCRALWANLEDPDREQTAARFYDENRAEMDAGSRVLDDDGLPIFACMVKLWGIGERQFYRDYQNDPRADGNALLDVELIKTRSLCRFDPTAPHGGAIYRRIGVDAEGQPKFSGPINLNDCQIAVWLDPRASEDVKRNDFAAIAMVARDSSGYRYVLRVDMQRDKPSGGRARMWRMYEWLSNRARYAYEDNGSQTLHGEGFDRDREERRDKGLPWSMTPEGYTSTTNKLDRIGRLQPDAELHGWIQFAEDLPGEFWEQGRDLRPGSNGHDDGWDAVERADWLLQSDRMPTIEGGYL